MYLLKIILIFLVVWVNFIKKISIKLIDDAIPNWVPPRWVSYKIINNFKKALSNIQVCNLKVIEKCNDQKCKVL